LVKKRRMKRGRKEIATKEKRRGRLALLHPASQSSSGR
jgi:hypothetical protein